MATRKRIQVPMPARLERRLLIWAHVRNELSLPGWVRTVLSLRVAANWDGIWKELETEARSLNMSAEDLERKVLERAGFDFDRELQELETDED